MAPDQVVIEIGPLATAQEAREPWAPLLALLEKVESITAKKVVVEKWEVKGGTDLVFNAEGRATIMALSKGATTTRRLSCTRIICKCSYTRTSAETFIRIDCAPQVLQRNSNLQLSCSNASSRKEKPSLWRFPRVTKNSLSFASR